MTRVYSINLTYIGIRPMHGRNRAINDRDWNRQGKRDYCDRYLTKRLYSVLRDVVRYRQSGLKTTVLLPQTREIMW